MIWPILACEDPYALAGELEKAGWHIDSSQPPGSGDPLVRVSLMDNTVLLGVTAGYVPERDIPHIGCGVELYLTVPGDAIEKVHRGHQRFRPTVIAALPWGGRAFKVKIGHFGFMIASNENGAGDAGGVGPAVRRGV